MSKAQNAQRQKRRHNALAQDYSTVSQPKQKSEKKRKHDREDDLDQHAFVDAKSSRRILEAGRELVEEDEAETLSALPNPNFTLESRQSLGSRTKGYHNDHVLEEDTVPDDDGDGDSWVDEEDLKPAEVVCFTLVFCSV